MTTKRVKYPTWTKSPWDGNPDLGYECWRKSFRRGHVSVGVGDFQLVVYSYGPNSDESLSSTRWRPAGPVSEEQAMEWVDKNVGHWVPEPH